MNSFRKYIIAVTLLLVIFPHPAQCARLSATLSAYQADREANGRLYNAFRRLLPATIGIALVTTGFGMLSLESNAQTGDSLFANRFSDEKVRFIDETYFVCKIDSLNIPMLVVGKERTAAWHALCDRYFEGDTLVKAFVVGNHTMVFRDSVVWRELLPHEYVHLMEKSGKTFRMFHRLEKAIEKQGTPALQQAFRMVGRVFQSRLRHNEKIELEFYAYYYGFLLDGYYELLNNDPTGMYRKSVRDPLIIAFAQFERFLDPGTRKLLNEQFAAFSLPLDVRMASSSARDVMIMRTVYYAA